MDEEVDDPTEMSDFLRDLRVYTATTMSLALRGDQGSVNFDPILFAAETARSVAETGRPLSEADGVLPPRELGLFQRDGRTGFRAFEAAKATYLLGRSTYLVVDGDLLTALQVVREKQQADAEERWAFAANPRAAIAERLGPIGPDGVYSGGGELGEDVEARAEVLVVETPEYADRAVGIGLWEQPRYDFIVQSPNQWMPESFPVELGGVWVTVAAEDVSILRRQVEEALEAGTSEVEYGGRRIPATPEVLGRLGELEGEDAPDRGPMGPDRGEPGREKPTVVLVHENFVEEGWAPCGARREAIIERAEPAAVQTSLLPHQREGLDWQIDAWCAGHLGVLNADDQGLGKTLQTLAFLAWLQENMAHGPGKNRKPLLVVAPKGLLRVWQDEARKHLSDVGLGTRVDVFGRALRGFQVLDLAGWDTDDGNPRLRFDDLESAMGSAKGHRWWLLTTYETLANYQHSFRRVDFAAVVFDEIQKIKNPATLIALAARAVKAEFRVGLTGTPIENQIADLWAIMDVLSPGRLGSMRDYIERYSVVTEEKMRELHGRLFKPLKNGDESWPPVAQRRFKDDVIDDLPRKNYRLYPATMPDRQARAYGEARRVLTDGAHGAALRLLHHLRGVSLHPETPDSVEQRAIDAYFQRSARFLEVSRILSGIRERGERVLIFTENLRMQGFLAEWLRSQFGLESVPIINGATTIPRRRQFVLDFQGHLTSDGGFAAMILSPRVAGVGLTLTAATHVIHLSRWWNPAVEEQCNDRIYRIGQTRDVTVHLPLAVHPGYREHSFDCVLNDLMRRKTSLAHAALWPPTNSDYDNGTLVAGVVGAEPLDPTTVDRLDWARFEEWILDRAKQTGDWMVARTPRTGDAGADAVLRHRRRKGTSALVQAKHTTNVRRSMDESAVEEIVRARHRYDVDAPQLVVITNASGFTERARQLALGKDVKLVDRDRLGLWPSHVLG